MAHSVNNADYIGEVEQRVVDLESEIGNLRQIVTRIGREKRTCSADRAWMMAYIIITMLLIDTVVRIFTIVK